MQNMLCFLALIIVFANTRDAQAQCPANWQRFQNSCYYIGKETKTWHDASVYCIANGGHLARIESKPENEYLKSYVKSIKADAVWVDLTNEGTKGKWRYSSNLKSITTSDWKKGEPSGDGNCGYLMRPNYQWNDESCTNKKPFACEMLSSNDVWSECDRIKVLIDELYTCKKNCRYRKK